MPDPRPYYSERGLSAVYYDAITDLDSSLDGDIDLYADLTPAGGDVLELGAGTGRVALALAERKLSVVGIDLAPAMLVQAQAKRARLPADVARRVTFQLGDMTSLRLDRRFDAVICPFFGLAHLPVGAAWRNAFEVVARHLKPDGRAAVHLPLQALLAAPASVEAGGPVLRQQIDGGVRELTLFARQRRYREPIGRFDQVLEYVVTGPRGQVERRSVERLTYYAADPAPFAIAAGLTPDGPPTDLGGLGKVHVYRLA